MCGPINFIKRILGIGLIEDIDLSMDFPRLHNLKSACLEHPGLENELKLLQCVNPLPEDRRNDHKIMRCQFYSMTNCIRDNLIVRLIEIDCTVFAKYNVDHLPLSHLPVSMYLYICWHNHRVEELYAFRTEKKIGNCRKSHLN